MKKFRVGQLYVLIENSFLNFVFYPENALFTLIHYKKYGRNAAIILLSQNLKLIALYANKDYLNRKFA